MKTYTIIGGVNGVGKSSLTGVLKEVRTDLGIIIDTELSDNADQRTSRCLEMGVDFTQETTLSGKKTIKTAITASEKDYFIRLYYIGLDSAEESLDRIANRVKNGGHDIPEKDVRRRFEKRFDDLLALLPYCNEAYFYDNKNGFFKAGEYQNGKIILTCDKPPRWIISLKNITETKGQP